MVAELHPGLGLQLEERVDSDKDALERCVEKAALGTAISIKLACSIGSNPDFQAGFSQAASIYKVLDKCTHRDL